jgi:hypothetical protein
VTGSLYKYVNKISNLRLKGDRKILHKIKRRTANWTGHILSKNCLIRHITEGKKEGVKE